MHQRITMDSCSGDELLTELLEGQLDDELAATVTVHVEACVSCQERLKRLTNETNQYMKWGYFGDASTPWLTSVHLKAALTAQGALVKIRRMTSDFQAQRPNGRFPPSKAMSSCRSSGTAEWGSSTRHASNG